MHKHDLISYLTGIGTASVFSTKIKCEVISYENDLRKKGSSCAVFVTGHESLEVNHRHITRLYRAFRKGEISLSALAYIADAITMDEGFTFTNEISKDIAHEFSELGAREKISDKDLNELDMRILNEIIGEKGQIS